MFTFVYCRLVFLSYFYYLLDTHTHTHIHSLLVFISLSFTFVYFYIIFFFFGIYDFSFFGTHQHPLLGSPLGARRKPRRVVGERLTSTNMCLTMI